MANSDCIEEKNPLKQGLKRLKPASINRAFTIEEKNPLKQGLKPHSYQLLILYHHIEEKNPLKQGLKLASLGANVPMPDN